MQRASFRADHCDLLDMRRCGPPGADAIDRRPVARGGGLQGRRPGHPARTRCGFRRAAKADCRGALADDAAVGREPDPALGAGRQPVDIASVPDEMVRGVNTALNERAGEARDQPVPSRHSVPGGRLRTLHRTRRATRGFAIAM